MNDRQSDDDDREMDEGTERQSTDSDVGYESGRKSDPDVTAEAERGDSDVERDTDVGASDAGTESDRDTDSESDRGAGAGGSETGRRSADVDSVRNTSGTESGERRADANAREHRDDPGNASGTDDDASMLKWVSGIASLVGLWIGVSPFVYETTQVAAWNNVAAGAAIFLLAAFGYYRATQNYRPDVGSSSLVALLGLWAVVAPFLLAFESMALLWSTVASGAVVAILSGYVAYESRRSEAPRTTGTRV